MKLVRFEETSYIGKKDIYCYEKSFLYLTELKAKYIGICDCISGIFDDYERNQGTFLFEEKSISVMPISKLLEIDWSKSILLITSDYFDEAFEKICAVFSKAKEKNALLYCPENIYYFANKETEIDLFYRELYKEVPLKNMIFFRSGPHASAYIKGLDFSDNARVLFEYMIKNHYNEKYKLVWAVKNPNEFKKYEKNRNVIFISFEWAVSKDKKKRDLYYKCLCLSKYIFMTDAYGFCRNARKDQVRIQLWHGCGFKTRTNFVPCEKRYEYNIVISEKYKEIHKEIYGLRDDQVLITGYPKEDLLFYPASKEKLRQLGIPENKKYIFWLPTFRTVTEQLTILNEQTFDTDTGLPIVYEMQELEKINHLLCENDMILVIKLHPFQKKNSVKCGDMSNIVLLENEQLIEYDVQVNELLGWAEALISDYSSAAIDYLILNRPIAFTLDDVEEYQSSRGFVFDNIREWLPGKELFSVEDFIDFINEVGQGIDSMHEKRVKIRKILHKYNDANSSKRVLDFIGIRAN